MSLLPLQLEYSEYRETSRTIAQRPCTDLRE